MRHPNRLTKQEEGWSRPGIDWRKQKAIVDEQTKPVHLPSRKRKKKEKKPYRGWQAVCPFCDATLPELPQEKDIPIWRMWGRKYGKACVCGASEHEDCPCCHRQTWAKNDWKGTLIYKHQKLSWFGCGFSGERLERKQK